MPSSSSRQGGFAIFSALFIVVFLALLSAGIATISTVSNVASAGDIQGVQARQAARAGLEWGLNKAWNQDAAVCSATGITTYFPDKVFGNMTVTLRCQTSALTEDGSASGTAYDVTAWACNFPDATSGTDKCPGLPAAQASPGYVERKVYALIKR